MTRLERLIALAKKQKACAKGIKAARTLPSRKVILRYGWWIMPRLGPRLHRREKWRIVKINPAGAVLGWDVLTQDMKHWLEERYPELVALSQTTE
jgi:hypothetical protein